MSKVDVMICFFYKNTNLETDNDVFLLDKIYILMRKIYHLKTCSTCQRILKSLPNLETFQLQDIKSEPMTVKQVEEMQKMAGSYEALFSKRATLYKEMGLKDKKLTEADFKRFILEHYTFLSRPVIISDENIFVGNSPKVVQRAIDYLSK
jgi:arsenate reductase-like glutaredoxin family protein